MNRRFNRNKSLRQKKTYRKNKQKRKHKRSTSKKKSTKNRHKGGFLKWQKKCMPGSTVFGCPSGKTCKWGSGFMDISYGIGLDNHHCF